MAILNRRDHPSLDPEAVTELRMHCLEFPKHGRLGLFAVRINECAYFLTHGSTDNRK
jgi:hypothetical protein